MSIIASIVFGKTTYSDSQTFGRVSIALTDANTGLPVNGNNIAIAYTRSDVTGFGAAVVTNLTAVIPGQSLLIYSGILSDTTLGNFTSFAISPQAPSAPVPAPPVNQCDLAINSIQVAKPESFPGAGDASIMVNATTSYGPVQYSLDNVNFQSSSTFTALTGGLKTVYAKDANVLGCLVSQNITIPVLRNLLIADPSVTIMGNVSYWNAAFNPIVFQYQRKDFEVTSITGYSIINQGTFAMLRVNADLTGVLPGDTVFVACGTGSTGYNGAYSVLQLGPTPGTLVLNAPFGITQSGYVNIDRLRPYYKIITTIQYNDPVSGVTYTAVSNNSPNPSGLVKADLKSFLRSLVGISDADTSNYTATNYRDYQLSASYRISYSETWQNADGTPHISTPVQVSNTYYVVYAAKQLKDQYGGNLFNYVPFPNLAAKWVTDFKTPAYSFSYPFDLSFIYSDALVGLNLYYKISLLDINQNPAGSAIASYLLNDDSSYLLNTDSSRLIISQVNLTNTSISQQVGLNRVLINNQFSDNVYYFTIGVFYKDSGNVEHQVMQNQLVRIDKQCSDNDVYLRWIGLTGSWNYYRFIHNQEVTLDVQNSVIIEDYVSDWQNAEGIERVISKSAGQKMQVHAEDMTIDDIKGCQSMKFSPKVQLWTGTSWLAVVVNTATFAEYETNIGTYAFAVTFNLPSINIQTA